MQRPALPRSLFAPARPLPLPVAKLMTRRKRNQRPSHSSAAERPRKSRSSDQPSETSSGGPERLQKVLAAAGLGSRRACEELIVDGRVEIDRQVVTELGTRVDPARQEVRVDGETLNRPRLAYYAVNKPVGVVCTNKDPDGRTRVIDLIRSDDRLFTIGRLDRNSEGLILVTNDGELANLLAHPRYGIQKVYRVHVAGHPTPELLSQLEEGFHLAEAYARVSSVTVRRRHRESTELEVVLKEGKNREIRRLLARIGHKVMRLKRVAMGPILLGDMPVGAYRRLSSAELRELRFQSRRAARAERSPKPRMRSSGSQKPRTQKTKSRKPQPQKSAAQKPATQKPATQKSATQKPATQKSATQKTRGTAAKRRKTTHAKSEVPLDRAFEQPAGSVLSYEPSPTPRNKPAPSQGRRKKRPRKQR